MKAFYRSKNHSEVNTRLIKGFINHFDISQYEKIHCYGKTKEINNIWTW